MPKMPLDVKKLLDSVASLGQERDVPVAVDLVIDPTASDALIDCLLDALEPGADKTVVRDIVLGTTLPDIAVPCDLCVIAGGDSLLLGDVASAARAKGIPAVVAIERGKTFFAENKAGAQALADAALAASVAPTPAGTASAPTVGKGIPLQDTIDIDLSGDDKHPLSELGTWIVTNAPAKRMALADRFAFLRRPLALEVIKTNAIQNGAIGVVFFVPGADMPLITLNQAKMVVQIAAIYGEPLTKERIKEVLAVVAGGFGMRALARKLVARVPVLGWAIKPTVAASGTLAMGYAALEYFGDGEGAKQVKAAAAQAAGTFGAVTEAGADFVETALDGFLAHRPR